MRRLLVLAFASTTACISFPASTSLLPDIGLKEVQRPAATQQRYGPQTITPVKDSAGKYRFEDDLIAVTFAAVANKVYFDLQNKTDLPIQIGWTEAAFVDPKGQSQPVMHMGMKYTDCSSPKAPSVLVGKGRVTDVVLPCGYVRMGYSSWVESDYFLIPSLVPLDSASAIAGRVFQALKGQTIRVLLPIKTQETVNDYTFTFELQGVGVAGRAKDATKP